MSHIRTADGWKPLWRLSPPTKPPFPIARETRPADEAWREEQVRALNEMRRIAAARSPWS